MNDRIADWLAREDVRRPPPAIAPVPLPHVRQMHPRSHTAALELAAMESRNRLEPAAGVPLVRPVQPRWTDAAT